MHTYCKLLSIHYSICLQAVQYLGDANEVLNERAVVVMARMSNKLTGRDFSSVSSGSVSTSSIQNSADHGNSIPFDTREVDHGLSIKDQVQKLIGQATSHENLCQNYVGYVCKYFYQLVQDIAKMINYFVFYIYSLC